MTTDQEPKKQNVMDPFSVDLTDNLQQWNQCKWNNHIKTHWSNFHPSEGTVKTPEAANTYCQSEIALSNMWSEL